MGGDGLEKVRSELERRRRSDEELNESMSRRICSCVENHWCGA